MAHYNHIFQSKDVGHKPVNNNIAYFFSWHCYCYLFCMYHDNGFKLYISENMGKEKQGFLSVNNQNSVTMLKTNCTKCERYKNSPIKAAIVTTINATVAGAAISLVMDAVFFYLRSTFSISPPRLVSLNLSNQLAKSISQEHMVTACTRGALLGIDAGITCVMKRIRGKEDVHTSMVAGMGAGVLVSLLHGRGLTNAIAFGVAIGLKNSGITKGGEGEEKMLEMTQIIGSMHHICKYQNITPMMYLWIHL
ncbi:Mitochondrial inner membrane translocase subunit Tim17/Tim22/Tim23/peroxisomal protein PMP24 [Artemisia annua]|uniref:Mitochondrial inner membrane translocase subunit Tim17/Tim22/Tim23/peroxisomal protein PMP24 n=1 Tax=Artemisia annua TaxID=35608 RepID=A0A2U1NRJ8_ARTAN|nr:Mitochondrial inner membrane translocase subunit Tim17/Tim22/Tim23/peroxisomal protein PMP24 [Artemisia annua]